MFWNCQGGQIHQAVWEHSPFKMFLCKSCAYGMGILTLMMPTRKKLWDREGCPRPVCLILCKALPVLLFTLMTLALVFSVLIYLAEPRSTMPHLPHTIWCAALGQRERERERESERERERPRRERERERERERRNIEKERERARELGTWRCRLEVKNNSTVQPVASLHTGSLPTAWCPLMTKALVLSCQ